MSPVTFRTGRAGSEFHLTDHLGESPLTTEVRILVREQKPGDKKTRRDCCRQAQLKH